jgi:leucyl-tRNA synthetase
MHRTWPTFDEAMLKSAEIEIPIQVNGKLRGRVTVPVDSNAAELESFAKSHAQIAELIAGKQILKWVIVPGRLVNVVVKG